MSWIKKFVNDGTVVDEFWLHPITIGVAVGVPSFLLGLFGLRQQKLNENQSLYSKQIDQAITGQGNLIDSQQVEITRQHQRIIDQDILIAKLQVKQEKLEKNHKIQASEFKAYKEQCETDKAGMLKMNEAVYEKSAENASRVEELTERLNAIEKTVAN